MVTNETPYQLWYEYLKISSSYLEQVKSEKGKAYEHLGNVFELSFKKWWATYGASFDNRYKQIMEKGIERIGANPNESGIQMVQSSEELEYYSTDGWQVVAIDLNSTKEQLVADFEKFLKPNYSKRKGRPEGIQREPMQLFAIVGRPNWAVVKSMLEVHHLCEQNVLKQHEIGEHLKLNAKLIPRKADSQYEKMQKRKKMSALVSTYKRRAQKIAEYATEGHFPYHGE